MSNTNFYKITYRRSLSDQEPGAHIRTDYVFSPRFTATLYKAIRNMAFYFCDDIHFYCYVVIERGDVAVSTDTKIVAIMDFTMYDYHTWVHVSDFSTGEQKVWSNYTKLPAPRVWENMNK